MKATRYGPGGRFNHLSVDETGTMADVVGAVRAAGNTTVMMVGAIGRMALNCNEAALGIRTTTGLLVWTVTHRVDRRVEITGFPAYRRSVDVKTPNTVRSARSAPLGNAAGTGYCPRLTHPSIVDRRGASSVTHWVNVQVLPAGYSPGKLPPLWTSTAAASI